LGGPAGRSTSPFQSMKIARAVGLVAQHLEHLGLQIDPDHRAVGAFLRERNCVGSRTGAEVDYDAVRRRVDESDHIRDGQIGETLGIVEPLSARGIETAPVMLADTVVMAGHDEGRRSARQVGKASVKAVETLGDSCDLL
jgi:hypothetical protein